MAKKPKLYGKSTKSGLHDSKKKTVKKNQNLGQLMTKHRDLADLLYGYASTADLVYEDMDFTIEEFCDMTGADLEELIEDINKVVYG